MSDELPIEKDLEGSGHGLIRIISWQGRRETMKNLST
jgi:hypothetical protein